MVGLSYSLHLNNSRLVLYQAECIAAIEGQIVIEFRASLQYLLMAAHFSQVPIPYKAFYSCP